MTARRMTVAGLNAYKNSRIVAPLYKLLQGWSLDAVTDWIMAQTDRAPFSDLKRSTVRHYLNMKEPVRIARASAHCFMLLALY